MPTPAPAADPERISAIVNAPEAAGRAPLARYLATQTDLSVNLALEHLRAAAMDEFSAGRAAAMELRG